MSDTPHDRVTRTAADQFGCGVCGHSPAVQTTFRGHEGLLILIRLPKVSGPLCRDCGITSFREMTALTLIRGWWSPISPFIAPIVIALNLLRRSRVARLAPPTRASDLVAPNTKPLGPVRPVLARPSSWLGIALIVGIATFVAVYDPGPAPAEPGCAVVPLVERREGDKYLIECDRPHDARVVAVVRDPRDCPGEAATFIEISSRFYCLKPERTF